MYQDLEGEEECKLCPSGQYQDNEGESTCRNCSIGRYQDLKGQEECELCPSGQYQDNEGESTCRNCSIGRYQDLKGQEECRLCPSGQYQDNEGESTCKNCSSGRYQDLKGQEECRLCPSGQYQDNEGESTCRNCTVGRYQDLEGEEECKLCPSGQYQDNEGESTCRNCTVGRYQDLRGQDECKLCPIGQYQDMKGESVCKNCSIGRYQDLRGQEECKLCPSGQYQISEGKSICKNCSIGRYQDLDGQVECELCPIGQYQDIEGQSICRNCSIGRYQDSKGQGECKLCPTGRYQDLRGQDECKLCPSGQYQNNEGKSICKNCSIGRYQDLDGQVECDLCPIGQYQDIEGQSICRNCSIGRYQDLEGQGECELCPIGTYQNMEGESKCKKCSVGRYQPLKGREECQLCSIGQYQDIEGQSICKNCSVGMYQDIEGQGECKSCSSGMFQSEPGSAACVSCSPGYYQDSEGQSSCLICEAGTYNSVFGMSACFPCAVGEYSDRPGRLNCFSCGVGAATSYSGSTSWSDCYAEPGYYWTANGAVRCAPPSACKGGSGSDSDVCASGYKGELCKNCRQGYYRDGVGECPKCQTFGTAFWIVLILILIVSILVMTRERLRLVVFDLLASYVPLLHFFQVISIFGSYKMGYGDEMDPMFSTGEFLMGNISSLALECVARVDIVVMSCLTWIITALLMITFASRALLKSPKFVEFIQNHIWKGFRKSSTMKFKNVQLDRQSWECWGQFVSLSSFCFLPLMRLVVLPFDCTATESGSYVLDADPSTACYVLESRWLLLVVISYASILLLLPYSLIIFHLILKLVVDENKDLLTGKTGERMNAIVGGLLYNCIGDHILFHVFWELGILKIRDIALLLVQIWASNFPQMQGILALCVIWILVVIVRDSNPYRFRKYGNGCNILLAVMLFILGIGLLNSSHFMQKTSASGVDTGIRTLWPPWVWHSCLLIMICGVMIASVYLWHDFRRRHKRTLLFRNIDEILYDHLITVRDSGDCETSHEETSQIVSRICGRGLCNLFRKIIGSEIRIYNPFDCDDDRIHLMLHDLKVTLDMLDIAKDRLTSCPLIPWKVSLNSNEEGRSLSITRLSSKVNWKCRTQQLRFLTLRSILDIENMPEDDKKLEASKYFYSLVTENVVMDDTEAAMTFILLMDVSCRMKLYATYIRRMWQSLYECFEKDNEFTPIVFGNSAVPEPSEENSGECS